MARQRSLRWYLLAFTACVAAIVAATVSTRVQHAQTESAASTPSEPAAASSERPIDVVAAEPAPRRVALDAPAESMASETKDDAAPAFGDPGTDGSEKKPRSPLAQRIDRVTASFATRDPDTIGLLDLVRDLAGQARVDASSVQGDAASDVATGRIALDGSVAQCHFEVSGDRLTIELAESGITGVPGAVARTISWTVSRGDASIECTVQHQPDARSATPGEEKILGWSVQSGAGGTRAVAISMVGSAAAWKIGPSETIPALEQPWLSANAPGEAWWGLVAPFVK